MTANFCIHYINGFLFSFFARHDFTALHGMHTQSSDENSVCPSVKRIDCDKTKEKCVQIFTPHEITFSLVFREKEWLVGATLST